jgi:hypothetical protein
VLPLKTAALTIRLSTEWALIAAARDAASRASEAPSISHWFSFAGVELAVKVVAPIVIASVAIAEVSTNVPLAATGAKAPVCTVITPRSCSEERFLKNKDNFVKYKTIIFDGIHYLHIFFWLMTKQYDKLADHVVNIDNTFSSQQEVVALLKERTERIV